MKFKIKDEEKAKPEQEIKLRLEGGKDGVIDLMGEDNGHSRYLMRFEDGRFFRYTSAQIDGLETDEDGRIQEEK